MKARQKGLCVDNVAGKNSAWATADWLSTHFWAKSANRLRQMASLPIREGDRVLDVGCGTGVYLSYVADLVGPTGVAVGIDHLEESVELTCELLARRGASHATAIHASLDDYLSHIDQYDIVLFMNSLGYSSEYRTIVKKVGTALSPGSRIIVKDYDLESILISPIRRSHWAQLLDAALQVDADKTVNPLPFTNFLGRHVPFLATAYPCRASEATTWTNMMSRPFSIAQRAYIWGNIESLVNQARGICSDDVLAYFEDEFATESGPFFERPEALFVENEYVTIMTK
jgi:precorrin-6B methylase 2